MNQVSDTMRAFFEEFERANNAFEPDLLAPLVSDPVVGADPNGGIQVMTKADYLAGTAESQAYLHALGFRFIKTVPVEEILLTPHYTMVKVHGTMRLEQGPGQPIDLVHDTTYILFIEDGKPQIVFTLTHEDPMKMMQERGVLPSENNR